MNKNYLKKSGFTLIELMIVVAIIGILAAVSVPKFGEAMKTNRIETAKAHMKSYEQALRNYYSDVHTLPAEADLTNGDGLNSIADWENYMRDGLANDDDPDSDSDGVIDNWHGSYMTKLNSDPWDNAYVFQDNRNDSDPDTITAIISGGPQNNINFDKSTYPNGDAPNERGFSVVEFGSNDYIIILWLD